MVISFNYENQATHPEVNLPAFELLNVDADGLHDERSE